MVTPEREPLVPVCTVQNVAPVHLAGTEKVAFAVNDSRVKVTDVPEIGREHVCTPFNVRNLVLRHGR
jgi:hypothetical protein